MTHRASASPFRPSALGGPQPRPSRGPGSERRAIPIGGALLLCLWLLALTVALAPAAAGDPADYGLELVQLDQPNGPGPPPPTPDFQLIVDDGTAESVFGFSGGTARQFLWLNRFDNPGTFQLEEIQVLFPQGMDVPVGGAVQLAVFLDEDRNAGNGATLLATFDVTITSADGLLFSSYPLTTPLLVPPVGDIWIGAINRYFDVGTDPPPTLPAAVDTTAPAGDSIFVLWPADPPNPPDLASATVIEALAGASAGNFMIRGQGSETARVVEVPALGGSGVLAFGALLVAAGALLMRRRL
ncbi:MAG: hypothetical protein AAF725_05110 [Acidobacteriota bacterium]